MGSTKVLVLDDSDIVRDSVRMMLEEQGYVVVDMASPFGFAAAVQSEKPHAALVDVNMPAITGDKIIEIAKRRGAGGCAIILFSDKSEDELAVMAQRCGAAGYIRKTNDGAQLAAAIEGFIRAQAP